MLQLKGTRAWGAVTMSGKVDVCVYAASPSLRTALMGDTIKACGAVERQYVPHAVMTAVNNHLICDEIMDNIGRGCFVHRWPAQYKTGSTTLVVMGFRYGCENEQPSQVGLIRVDIA